MRRRRGRQVAPCGHTSTVGQRFLRLVLRDDQEERRRTALTGEVPGCEVERSGSPAMDDWRLPACG
jgi:hypothetical protein